MWGEREGCQYVRASQLIWVVRRQSFDFQQLAIQLLPLWWTQYALGTVKGSRTEKGDTVWPREGTLAFRAGQDFVVWDPPAHGREFNIPVLWELNARGTAPHHSGSQNMPHPSKCILVKCYQPA